MKKRKVWVASFQLSMVSTLVISAATSLAVVRSARCRGSEMKWSPPSESSFLPAFRISQAWPCRTLAMCALSAVSNAMSP